MIISSWSYQSCLEDSIHSPKSWPRLSRKVLTHSWGQGPIGSEISSWGLWGMNPIQTVAESPPIPAGSQQEFVWGKGGAQSWTGWAEMPAWHLRLVLVTWFWSRESWSSHSTWWVTLFSYPLMRWPRSPDWGTDTDTVVHPNLPLSFWGLRNWVYETNWQQTDCQEKMCSALLHEQRHCMRDLEALSSLPGAGVPRRGEEMGLRRVDTTWGTVSEPGVPLHLLSCDGSLPPLWGGPFGAQRSLCLHPSRSPRALITVGWPVPKCPSIWHMQELALSFLPSNSDTSIKP
jgi:hypothetical protein